MACINTTKMYLRKNEQMKFIRPTQSIQVSRQAYIFLQMRMILERCVWHYFWVKIGCKCRLVDVFACWLLARSNNSVVPSFGLIVLEHDSTPNVSHLSWAPDKRQCWSCRQLCWPSSTPPKSHRCAIPVRLLVTQSVLQLVSVFALGQGCVSL